MSRLKKFPLPKPVKVEVDIDEVPNLATERTTLPQLEAWNKEIIESIAECTSSRDVKTFLNILKKYVKFLRKDYSKCWDRVVFIKSIQRHVMAMGDYFSAHAENVKYEFDYVFYITKIIGLYCTLELEVHRNALSQVGSKCDFVTSVTNRLLGLMFVSLNFTSGRVSDVLLRIEYSRTNKFHSAVMTRLYHHCLLAIPLETTSYAAFYSYYLNFQDMQELTPKHLRAEQKKYLLQSFGKSQEEVKDDLILKKILETPTRSTVKTVEHIVFPRKRTTRSYFRYLQSTQTCHLPSDRNISEMMETVAIISEGDSSKCQNFQNTFNFTDTLLTSSESESESEQENVVCEIDVDSDFEEITYIKKQPPKRKERHKKKQLRRDGATAKKPSFSSSEVIVLDSSEEEEDLTPQPQVSASIFENDTYTHTTFNRIEYTALTSDFTAPEFHHGLITPPRERCGLFDDNIVIGDERECEEQGIFEDYNDRAEFDPELSKNYEEQVNNSIEENMDVELEEVIGREINESDIVQHEILQSFENRTEFAHESEVIQPETIHPQILQENTPGALKDYIHQTLGTEEETEVPVSNTSNDLLTKSYDDIAENESVSLRNENVPNEINKVGTIKINDQLREEKVVEELSCHKPAEVSEIKVHNHKVLIGSSNVIIENNSKTIDTDSLVDNNNLTGTDQNKSIDTTVNKSIGSIIQKETEAPQMEHTEITNIDENLGKSPEKHHELNSPPGKMTEDIFERMESINEEFITSERVAEIIYGKSTNEKVISSNENLGSTNYNLEPAQNLQKVPETQPKTNDAIHTSKNVIEIEVDYDNTSEESYTITGGNNSPIDEYNDGHSKQTEVQSSDVEGSNKVDGARLGSPRVLYTSSVEEFDQFEARINQSDQIQKFTESCSEIDAFLSGPIENTKLNDQYYGDNDLPAGDLFALVNNGLKAVLPHVDIPIKFGATKSNPKPKRGSSNDLSTSGKVKKVTFSADISTDPIFHPPLPETIEKRSDSPTPSPVFEKWRKQYTGEFKKVLKDINKAVDTAAFLHFDDASGHSRDPTPDDTTRTVTFSDRVQMKYIPSRTALPNYPFVYRNGVKCFVNRTDVKVFWDAAVELHPMTPAQLRKYNIRVALEHNTRTTCLLEKHEFRKSGPASRLHEEYNPALHYSGRAESYDENYSLDDRSLTPPIPDVPEDPKDTTVTMTDYLGSNNLISRGGSVKYKDNSDFIANIDGEIWCFKEASERLEGVENCVVDENATCENFIDDLIDKIDLFCNSGSTRTNTCERETEDDRIPIIAEQNIITELPVNKDEAKENPQETINVEKQVSSKGETSIDTIKELTLELSTQNQLPSTEINLTQDNINQEINLEQQVIPEKQNGSEETSSEQDTSEQQNNLDTQEINDKDIETYLIEQGQQNTGEEENKEIEPCESTKAIFKTIHEIAISLTSKELDRNTKLKTLTKLLSTIISTDDLLEKEDCNNTVKDNPTATSGSIPLQAIAIQTDSSCISTTNKEAIDTSSTAPLQAIAIQTEMTAMNTNEDVNSTKVANVVGDKLILDMSKFNNTEFDVQAIKDAVNMKNGKFNEEAVVKVLVEISSAKNQLSAEPLQEDLIECLSGDSNKSHAVSKVSDVDHLKQSPEIGTNNSKEHVKHEDYKEAKESIIERTAQIDKIEENQREGVLSDVSPHLNKNEHNLWGQVENKINRDIFTNKNTSAPKMETKNKTSPKIQKSSEKSKKPYAKPKDALKPTDKPLYNINKLHENLTKKIMSTKHDKSRDEINNRKACLKSLFGDSDDEMEIVISKNIPKEAECNLEIDNYEKYKNSLKTYDENCLAKTAQEIKKKNSCSVSKSYEKHFDLGSFKLYLERDANKKLVTKSTGDELNQEELRVHNAKKINTHKRRYSETYSKEELKNRLCDDSKYKHIYHKFEDLLPIEQPSVKLVDYLALKKENMSSPKDPIFKTVLNNDRLKNQKHKGKHMHKVPKLEKSHFKHIRKPESLATLSRNSLKSHKARRKSLEKVEETSHKIGSIEDTKIRIVKCDSHESSLSPYIFSENNEKIFGQLIDYHNEDIVGFKKELKNRRKSVEQKELVTRGLFDTSDTETADESVISVATCISVKKQQCLNQIYNKNRNKSVETRVSPVMELQDNQRARKKANQGSRKRRKINEDPLYRGQCTNIQQVTKICPYGTRQHWDLREYTLNEVIDIGRKGVLGPLESLPSIGTVSPFEKASDNNCPDNISQQKQSSPIEVIKTPVEDEAEIESNSRSDTLENLDETIATDAVEYESEDNLVIDETSNKGVPSNIECTETNDNASYETNFNDIQVDIQTTYEDDDDDSSRDLVICSDESRMSDTENSMDQTNLFNLNNVTNDETNISPLLFDSNFYLSDQPANKITNDPEEVCSKIESSIQAELQASTSPVNLPNRSSPSLAPTKDTLTTIKKNVQIEDVGTLTTAQNSEETCFEETETSNYYAERMETTDTPESCFDNSRFMNRFPKITPSNVETAENTNDNFAESFERQVHDFKRKWDYEDDDIIYWTLVKDRYMLPPKKRCRVSSVNNQSVPENNHSLTQPDMINSSGDGSENLIQDRDAIAASIREIKNQVQDGFREQFLSAKNNVNLPAVSEPNNSGKSQLLHSQQPLLDSSSNILPYPIINTDDIMSQKMNDLRHSRMYYPLSQPSSTVTSSKVGEDVIPHITYDSDAVLNFKCPSNTGQLPSYNQIFGKYNPLSNFRQSSTSVQCSNNEPNRTVDMEDPIQIMDDGSYKVSLTEEKVLRGEVNSMLRSEKNACYIMAVLTGNKDNVACPFDFEEAEDMKVADFETVCNYVLSVITQEFFQNCYNKSNEDTNRPKKNSNLSENGSYTAVKGLNCASAMIYRRLLIKCLRRLRPVFKTPAERKQMPHQLQPSREPPPSMVQQQSIENRTLSVEPRSVSLEPRPLPMEPPPPYTPSPTLPPTPLPQNIVVKFINPFVHPTQPTYSVPEIHVKLETSNVEEQSIGGGARRRNCTTFRIT